MEEQLKNTPGLERLWPVLVDYLEKNSIEPETIKSVLPVNMVNIIPNYHQLGIKELIYHMNRIRTFEKARTLYKPGRKISMPVHYFAAASTPGSMNSKEKWNNYCRKPIAFYKVKGDHFSILKPPGVVEFAKLFDRIIGS